LWILPFYSRKWIPARARAAPRSCMSPVAPAKKATGLPAPWPLKNKKAMGGV
jgi:hypothetical protein